MIEVDTSLLGTEKRYRWPREDGVLALDGEIAGELVTTYADRPHFLVPVSTRPDAYLHDPFETKPYEEISLATQEYRFEQLACRDYDGNVYVVPLFVVGPLELQEQDVKLFEFLVTTWRAWWLGRIWWLA